MNLDQWVSEQAAQNLANTKPVPRGEISLQARKSAMVCAKVFAPFDRIVDASNVIFEGPR